MKSSELRTLFSRHMSAGFSVKQVKQMAFQSQFSSKAVITSIDSVIGGGVISNAKPVITGTADAGSIVNIYDGVRLLGSATVGMNGTWSFTPAADLKSGNHQFAAIAMDDAGNFGTSSVPLAVTVAANTVVNPIVNSTTDRGGSLAASSTSDARPDIGGTATPSAQSNYATFAAVSAAAIPPAPSINWLNGRPLSMNPAPAPGTNGLQGMGEPGDLIKVYSGSSLLGSGTVSANGIWSISQLPGLVFASDVYVTQTNSAGGVSLPSSPASFGGALGVPVTPVLTDDTGSLIVAGSTTQDTHPNLSGTGMGGDTIKVYDGPTLLGSVTIGANGKWTMTSPDLSSGSRDFYVIATTPEGASSVASDHVRIVIDTSAPAVPVITSLVDALGPLAGNVAPGGIATDGQPTLKGIGHAGNTINVYDGTALLGTAKVAGDGTWSFKPASALASGAHSLHVTATNAAGVTSDVSAAYAFSFTQVYITSVTDSHGAAVSNGGTTNGTVTVTGWIDPSIAATGAAFYLSGGNVGTGKNWNTADSSQYGNIVISGNTFVGQIAKTSANTSFDVAGSGTYKIDVAVAGAGGRAVTQVNPQLGWTITDTFGTAAPSAPVITGLIDSVGTITGPITSGMTTDDPRPTLNGKGTAGDTIKLYDGQTLIGSTTVNADGTWSVQPAAALKNGAHDLYATETNAQGTSGHSADISFTVNTDTPAKPGIPVIADDHATPIVAGGTTADAHPSISGTGTAGDIVKVYDGSSVIGSVTIASDGKWTFKPATDLSSGSHDFYVTETNAAGTSSAASDHIRITVGTVLNAPVITGLVDAQGPLAGNVAPGGLATDGQPTLKGTGHAGDTINVYDGNTLLGTTTVAGDGTWSFKPATVLKSGTHNLHATETNGAGATSDASQSYAFTFTQILITGVYENGTLIPAGETAHGTVMVTGWIDPDLHAATGALYLTGGGVGGSSWASVSGGSIHIDGSSFVAQVGKVCGLDKTQSVTAGDFQVDFRFTGTGGTAQTLGNSKLAVTFSDDFTLADTVPRAPTIISLIDNVGPVTGLITSGMTIDDPRPTMSGTGNPGDAIRLYDGLKVIGSTMVGFDGTWTVRPDAVLKNGTHQFFVTESNAMGASPWSTDVEFTLNTPVPATPGIPVMTDENGTTVASGSTTADAHLSFTGTGAAGDTIYLYDGSTAIGSVKIGESGNWTVKPSIDLWSGAHNLYVVELSPVGVPSAASDHVSVVVSNGTLTFGEVTYLQYGFAYSAASGDTVSIESSNGMKFGGYGEVGDIVKIYDGSTLIASVVVESTGQWNFQNLVAFASGGHSLSATQTKQGGAESAHTPPFALTVGIVPSPPSLAVASVAYWQNDVYHSLATGDSLSANSTNIARLGGFAASGVIVSIYDGLKLIGTSTGAVWTFTTSDIFGPGKHSLTVTQMKPGGVESLHTVPIIFNVSAAPQSALLAAPESVAEDHAHANVSALSNSQPDHVTVVSEHGTFKGTVGGNETVALAMDPKDYFKLAAAHIEGAKGGAVDTLHLTGDHQVLDLTSLSGKTAAAKISGVEVIDLGGQHNTVKLSMVDVLNLGETDLFQKDGKQQMMVKGAEGDTVDLLSVRVAGLADGEWHQQGTAQVSGVTYAVYEHSGAHTELLVQQGVQIVLH